jgi:hypothetical protein
MKDMKTDAQLAKQAKRDPEALGELSAATPKLPGAFLTASRSRASSSGTRSPHRT